HGVGEVQRYAMDALPVPRHQVDPFFDRLLDAERAAPAGDLRLALEHVDGAEVEGRLGTLGIQKPCVTGGKRLVERLGRFHAVILFANLKASVAAAAELSSAATLSTLPAIRRWARGFPARGILIPLALQTTRHGRRAARRTAAERSGFGRRLELGLELFLQDLSCRALRQGLHELHGARIFVRGETLLDEGDDVFRGSADR